MSSDAGARPEAGAEVADLPKFRTHRGPLGMVQRALFVLLPLIGIVFLLDIPSYLGMAYYLQQYLGAFMGISLALVFLAVPAHRRAPRDRVPWYDLLLALLALLAGMYVAALYPKLIMTLGERTPDRVGLGAATIVLLLEAARRLVGWPLVIIGVSFLFYALFAHLFPEPFYDRPNSIQRLSTYLYLDVNGVLGQALGVAGTTVLAFIFFGDALHAGGGGRFITDFAMWAMGRARGGPAKMSVVSSSLFGTISGSAVANVVVDGVINIPLMKKTGYPPHVSAAIEAVASTGGQIMPPVMGAAAFVMAEFLAIRYGEIAIAALVPALLFYLALFVQIDLEAGKLGMRGLRAEELPRLRKVARYAPVFLIPLAVLVYTMFSVYLTAEKAALSAAAAVVLLSQAYPEFRLTPRRLIGVLEQTGRAVLDIATVTGVAGIVIGVLSLTGLGFTLTLALVQLGEASPMVLLVLAAGVGLVLGMGMPTTAVYILLAVLVAPVLVKLGIQPLAAHLFVFYWGMLSMITPPVCLASYAAASLAGADPMRAGYAGMRLGILAYIVPFLFVFSPRLLMQGPAEEVVLAIVTASAGTVLLGAALVGYLFRPLSWTRRCLFAVAALGLLIPTTADLGPLFSWASDALGVVLGAGLLFWEWRGMAGDRRATAAASAAERSIARAEG